MEKRGYLFTSESVGIGHPDKVCDAISDAILDACLSQDPESHVAVETLVTSNHVTISGEVTTKAQVDFEKVARDTIRDIGYTDETQKFDHKNAKIFVLIHEQSPDINQGVSEGQGLYQEQGAGDQGLMFGFASNETENYMPLPIYLAHKLVIQARAIRENKQMDYILPDCKSQVTVYYENDKPKYIDTIVFSTHHQEIISLERIRKDVIEKIIRPTCGPLLTESTKVYINPTGRFVIGGPHGDAGLTGRKIIVDTYGGYARHGGGAFSGKDPTKVDRSAAYAARWVAKNVVASGLAEKCEVQLSYAIGYSQPLNVTVETFGTGKFSESKIEEAISKVFDLSPKGIISSLGLKKPIYKKTSFGGHFGQKPSEDFFPWEKLDKIEELRAAAFSL
jgi:S-adenosylmethionine synthetase